MTTTAGKQNLGDIAGVCQRLAVLLGAGVSPGAAWAFVAETTGNAVVAAAVGQHDVSSALVAASGGLDAREGEAWRGLAAVWSVATDAGAPLAATLRDYAVSLRALADATRDADVALAGPRATARVVLVLPFVGLVFGALLGFGTLDVLVGTPAGWAMLLVGAGLIVAARLWNRRLVASALSRSATPGIACELAAVAVSGGGALDRAVAATRDAVRRFELDAAADGLDEVLALSSRAGVPAAELLRAEAEEQRRDARADAQAAAAALGVRLMLPLGLCILPAFLILGVAPLLVAVLSSTVAGL
ncbi:tight adherence protein B [Microbacteriaceae bacterium SG_E_30_P1]|uniref:Tight adherence protein B n=1 Tax=Antiquaquibacter oligotrophicus TaxID=2880260 RepID=A0ABT6KPB2_9MICO|nr:type II secretion system F family protein [Antiquaquibacter oligotrophicus]MDH6181837.1 tight adherence protein B [Antiquaquibacter oligotrophicus]UDF12486.1 type II secretion system F family protein [Antiquaquibacter oligotrophicus]